MGNGTQSRGYHQEIHPTMKLPVSDTRINSSSEWCWAGAALEDDPAIDLRCSSSPVRLLLAGSGGSDLPLPTCPQTSRAALASKGVFTF